MSFGRAYYSLIENDPRLARAVLLHMVKSSTYIELYKERSAVRAVEGYEERALIKIPCTQTWIYFLNAPARSHVPDFCLKLDMEFKELIAGMVFPVKGKKVFKRKKIDGVDVGHIDIYELLETLNLCGILPGDVNTGEILRDLKNKLPAGYFNALKSGGLLGCLVDAAQAEGEVLVKEENRRAWIIRKAFRLAGRELAQLAADSYFGDGDE